MANDRNIIKWSLDNKAFESKSYIEIFNMLLANYRAIYGNEIDLSVDTAFGEELRMNTELYHEFALLAQDIYYTLDFNNAKGAILDNLVAFTSNLVRKTNIQTIVRAELQFEGDILNYNENNRIYVQDTDGLSWKVEFINPTLVDGDIIAGIEPNLNKYDAVLTCVSYGENYISRLVMMSVGNRFHTGVVNTSNIIYDQIGSIEETDEMLRMRKNNLLSYNSIGVLDSIRDYILKNIISVKDVKVYNANGRKTIASELDSKGSSILDMLLTLGTKDIVVDGNTITVPNQEVKMMGVAKHDILVIIQPQEGLNLDSFVEDEDLGLTVRRTPTRTSVAIAEAIKRKITPGIATSAAHHKVIIDASGDLVDEEHSYDVTLDSNNEYTILGSESLEKNYINVKLDVEGIEGLVGASPEEYRFYIAQRYAPKLTISLQVRNNYDKDTSRARIRESIYNLSRNYTINKDIDIAEVLTAAMNANLDILNPTFIPINIVVGEGLSADGVKVNNGYWLVDRDALDYNIIIMDER